jgi:transcriptional regulator with XRE-family HTH domain
LDIEERIKFIRTQFAQSQDEFGAKIGLKKSAISRIETGSSNPSEQTIKLICREFGVSYDWLKNGNEPMMVPQEYAQKGKVEALLDGDNEFIKQIFYGLSDMPEEWWDEAEKVLRSALGIKKDR